MDSNLPKANNMLIELKLETWLCNGMADFEIFERTPRKENHTFFFAILSYINGNGNGVTVTKQVDVKKKKRGMMLKLAAWFCSFQKPKSR